MSTETIVTAGSQPMYDRFHFADATVSDGFIFCSGAIGAGVDGPAQEEFRGAWKKIGEVLEQAGASYTDIVEYTSYHVGLQEHMADFMAVRDEFISEPWPAWTAIGITELAMPGARVEIRVTAKKPG